MNRAGLIRGTESLPMNILKNGMAAIISYMGGNILAIRGT